MANEKTRIPVWLKIVSGILIALNVIVAALAVFVNVNSAIAAKKGVLPNLFSYSYACFCGDEILPKYEDGSLLLIMAESAYEENEEVIVLNSGEYNNAHPIEAKYALAKISEIGEAKTVLRLFPQEETEFAVSHSEIIGSVQYIVPVWGAIMSLAVKPAGILLFAVLPVLLVLIIIVTLIIVKNSRMKKYNEFSLDYDDGDDPIIKLPMPESSDENDGYDLFRAEETPENPHEKLDFVPLHTTALADDFYSFDEEKEPEGKPEEKHEEETSELVLEEGPVSEAAAFDEPSESSHEENERPVLVTENGGNEAAPFEEADEVVAVYDGEKSANEFAPPYLKLFERQTLEEFKHSLDRREDKYSIILNDGDLSFADERTKARLMKLSSFDADFMMDVLNERAHAYDEADEASPEENMSVAFKTIEAMTEEIEQLAPSFEEESAFEPEIEETAEEPTAEEFIPFTEPILEEESAFEPEAEETAEEPTAEEFIPFTEPIIEEEPAFEPEADEIAEEPMEEEFISFTEPIIEEKPVFEPEAEEIAEEPIEEEIEPITIKEIVMPLDMPVGNIDTVYDYPGSPVEQEIAPVIDEEELTPAQKHELELRAQKAKQDVLISNMARMYYDINLENYND